jgi:hypothetical protein
LASGAPGLSRRRWDGLRSRPVQAVVVVTNSRRCELSPDEVKRLVGELRRLMLDGAAEAATILEAALAEDMAADVSFEPAEEAALHRALHGMVVKSRRLTTGLQCLWDGLRIDAGV